MKEYEILVGEHRGVIIKVKATNRKEAEHKVDGGEWTDKDIVSSELIDRTVVGVKEEDDYEPLYSGAPHQELTLEELESRVCTCGELIEKCPDSYEHMTQGA